MNKNKKLLLASSLGVLLLLVFAAVKENILQEWRQVQSTGRSEEGPISVQLRQVVNVSMRSSDRCVSCHVSMAAGEQSVAGSGATAKLLTPHKPVVHDPAEYGCTVCHGGQGLATEREAAHGEIEFWPEPMIPTAMSQAGCGTCHAPLHVPNRDLLQPSRAAFERLDCLACHKLDGRGGTIRPDGRGMEGPDLSRAGINGYDKDWYAKHLQHSTQAASGPQNAPPTAPWKASFAQVSDADRELLDIFLASRVAAPKLVEAKAVFHSSGCMGCHKVGGVGGDEGPELSREGEKDPGQIDFTHVPGKPILSNWLREHFRSPVSLVTGSAMPILGVSESDIESLTMYMLSLRRRELPGSYLSKDRVRSSRFGEREFASDGATIFTAFCTGCHGPNGAGRRAPGMPAFPAISNPDFLSLVSDQFLKTTITKGRPGRRMLAWGEKDGGLRPEEIDKVVAHLRKIGGVEYKADSKPARWVSADVRAGEKLFAHACSGCHGAKGEGVEGPALNNKVLLSEATDTYLVETIGNGRRGTGMEGFLEPNPARRALTRPEIESVVAFIRTWEGKK